MWIPGQPLLAPEKHGASHDMLAAAAGRQMQTRSGNDEPQGVTFVLSNRNAAIIEIARTFHRLMGPDAPVAGLHLGLPGWFQQVATVHSPLDGNFKFISQVEFCMATQATAHRKCSKDRPSMDLTKCTGQVIEKKRVVVGAPASENTPYFHSITREAGGDITKTGDNGQNQGDGETRSQRTGTEHARYMDAGGKGSHTFFQTGPAIIAKAELLIANTTNEHTFSAKHKEVTNLTAQLSQSAEILCRQLADYRARHRCPPQCGSCEGCKAVNLETTWLQKLASSSFRTSPEESRTAGRSRTSNRKHNYRAHFSTTRKGVTNL